MKEKGLYLIRNNYNNNIKIGITDDIEKRIKQLESYFYHVGIKCDLELLYYVHNIDNIGMEKRLHSKYKNYRVCGEWFAINNIINSVITYIDNVIKEERNMIKHNENYKTNEEIISYLESIEGNKLYCKMIDELIDYIYPLNKKGTIWRSYKKINEYLIQRGIKYEIKSSRHMINKVKHTCWIIYKI